LFNDLRGSSIQKDIPKIYLVNNGDFLSGIMESAKDPNDWPINNEAILPMISLEKDYSKSNFDGKQSERF
jgi:hypothetical protein